MNEELLDLRRFTRAVLAGKWFLVVFVSLGCGVGGIAAARLVPDYSSRAVVLLPPAALDSAGQSARDIETQVQLASSDVVLVIASNALGPGFPTTKLQRMIGVKAPTEDILVFQGHARSAHEAIAVTNAAANAYRVYSSANNAFVHPTNGTPAGPDPATAAIQVISPATTASSPFVRTLVTYMVVGALAGLIVGLAVVLARQRRDHRLRAGNEIAAAADAPIVASMATPSPRKPSEWLTLLEAYEPRPEERWSLRRLVRDLLNASASRPARVTVVTLTHDEPALAVGPQLAAFAAASGVHTALVVAGTQTEFAALRHACDVASSSGALDRPHLSIVETVPQDDETEFVVSIVVADAAAADRSWASTALLAVSPGAAAYEEIAALATAAANSECPFVGVIVTNGDAVDAAEDVDAFVAPRVPRRSSPGRAAPARRGSVS